MIIDIYISTAHARSATGPVEQHHQAASKIPQTANYIRRFTYKLFGVMVYGCCATSLKFVFLNFFIHDKLESILMPCVLCLLFMQVVNIIDRLIKFLYLLLFHFITHSYNTII